MMNQKQRFKQFAVGITFALSLSLTACGSNNEDPVAQQTPPAVTEAPETAPSTEPTVEPSIEPTKEPAEDKDNNKKEDERSETSVLIDSIHDLAKKGKVPNCSYAASTALFDEIEKNWGKPDSNETAGKGNYAVYENKGITFGYNKGLIVFDVRSYESKLQKITLKEIEAQLGKADEKTVNGKDDIYMYEVNDQFQLKFIIPQSSGKVHHISVFSPKDAKNNMAG